MKIKEPYNENEYVETIEIDKEKLLEDMKKDVLIEIWSRMRYYSWVLWEEKTYELLQEVFDKWITAKDVYYEMESDF